jgi:glucokinase
MMEAITSETIRGMPMTESLRLALVGDIGGTNARFAIADIDTLEISDFAVFPCARFPSLPAVIRAYLDGIPKRPAVASLAIAAAMAGDPLHLTNLSWTFTRDELAAATGAATPKLLNDFEALALSLPHLGERDLQQIGGEAPADGAMKAVLGPGTGLGVAGLLGTPCGWMSVASEGGHISFAPENAEELAIAGRIGQGLDHISAERLISGPGLVSAYQILADMRGKPTGPLPASDIVKAALARTDPIAEETLELFVTWLGRFAGDVALMLGARGGVYLGGGIAPKILPALTTGAFRKAFQSKGRMSPYVASLPVYVITTEDAGLRGAAAALSGAHPNSPIRLRAG